MPLIKVDVRKNAYSEDQKSRLADAIIRAIMESWQVPGREINLRMQEYAKEDYRIPSGSSDGYIIIEIVALQGRTLEAKKIMIEAIRSQLSSFSLKPYDVLVCLNEVPKENLAVF